MSENTKGKIEAILYCMTQGVNLPDLAKSVNLGSTGQAKLLLLELQKEYYERNSGLMITEENNIWRLKIRDSLIETVTSAAKPEFDKAILETLAYVAHRGGARQCDTVRVRSNKAYAHINLLIEKGFITSEKSGLTKFLRPTKKFYEYFKLKPGEALKLK